VRACLPLPSARHGIGYVFQEAALFPHLSMAGNIGYGLRGWPGAERTAWVLELIGLMGLDGFADRRPAELSGGQKQRVALARALAPRPRLVLLNDPFAALNRAAADLLRHNLRQILQTLGVPVILVTHDLQEAYACICGEGVSPKTGPHGRMSQRNRLPATILQIDSLGALSGCV
jgi:iron(III) transport system ATP-binding protein